MDVASEYMGIIIMKRVTGSQPDQRVIILGNLNVGKTTLFNLICKKTAQVSNYPGTSVEIGRGHFHEGGKIIQLIDTPGIDNINAESEDEVISRNLLLEEQPQSIALVGDGKNLRRTLLLALQLSEYQTPLLLNLNMMDEARQRGIQINRLALSSILGVEVTSTVATEGEGLLSFRKGLTTAKTPKLLVRYHQEIEKGIDQICRILSDASHRLRGAMRSPLRAISTLLLSGDKGIIEHIRARWGEAILVQINSIVKETQDKFSRQLSLVMSEARVRVVNQIVQKVQVTCPPLKIPWAERIGEWARQPLTAIPIALGMLFLMYLFVGWFGAQFLVGLLEGEVFGNLVIPFSEKIFAGLPAFIQEALVGKFGLISTGLTLALGIVLPVLVTFFFAFGILEDLGYVPRLSVLLDRILRKLGLNGKGIVPLILGLNCITMAVLSTRILDTKKQRFIGTFLVIGLPCAPLLAVMLTLFASVSFWVPIVVFGIILSLKILTGIIANKVVKGSGSDFIIEVPPLRFPGIKNILIKTFNRTKWFVKEAIPYFLAATFIIFLLDQIGTLQLIQRLGAPIVKALLGLPVEATEVFIMSAIRRESGAAALKQMFDSGGLATADLIVCLLVMTFIIPCLNTFLVTIKQHGIKTALAIFGIAIPYAVLVGTVVNWSLYILGV
jgi:ferrous iron transport protein B